MDIPCYQDIHLVTKIYTLLPRYTPCYQDIHLVTKIYTLLPRYTPCYQDIHLELRFESSLTSIKISSLHTLFSFRLQRWSY